MPALLLYACRKFGSFMVFIDHNEKQAGTRHFHIYKNQPVSAKQRLAWYLL
jgi:hypothetical protein